MIYGVEINEAHVRLLKQYEDKENITQLDLAEVALSHKATNQNLAELRQAELKGEYGTG